MSAASHLQHDLPPDIIKLITDKLREDPTIFQALQTCMEDRLDSNDKNQNLVNLEETNIKHGNRTHSSLERTPLVEPGLRTMFPEQSVNKDQHANLDEILSFFNKRPQDTQESLACNNSNLLDSSANTETLVSFQDFLPNGKLAHIFIPRYVYVPKSILKLTLGKAEIDAKDELSLWSKLTAARNEAARAMSDTDQTQFHKQIYQVNSPLLSLAGEDSKNNHFSIMDAVQHSAAHKFLKNTKLENVDAKLSYDLFIRPLEHLFAKDMVLHQKLMESQSNKDCQEWLLTKVLTMVGIEPEPYTNSDFFFTELSKIKMLNKGDLTADYDSELDPIAVDTAKGLRHPEPKLKEYPRPEDFYPGGKLYGTYVELNTPISHDIMMKFNISSLSIQEENIFRTSIALARAKWAQDVHRQLQIQSGSTSNQHIGLSNNQAANNPHWVHKENQHKIPPTTQILAKLDLTNLIPDIMQEFNLLEQIDESHLSSQMLAKIGINSPLSNVETKLIVNRINKILATFRPIKRDAKSGNTKESTSSTLLRFTPNRSPRNYDQKPAKIWPNKKSRYSRKTTKPTNTDAHKVTFYRASASHETSNSTTNSKCEKLTKYSKLSHIPVAKCVESNSSTPTNKEQIDIPKTFTLKNMESTKDRPVDFTENQKDHFDLTTEILGLNGVDSTAQATITIVEENVQITVTSIERNTQKIETNSIKLPYSEVNRIASHLVTILKESSANEHNSNPKLIRNEIMKNDKILYFEVTTNATAKGPEEILILRQTDTKSDVSNAIKVPLIRLRIFTTIFLMVCQRQIQSKEKDYTLEPIGSKMI